MNSFKLIGLEMLIVAIVGCGGNESGSPSKAPAKDKKTQEIHAEGDEHEHGPGPHGGTIFDLGKYHAEFTVDHGKQEATIYILGADQKTPTPVASEKLELTIKNPSIQVELKPLPLEGESGGKSSRFVGKHEKLGVKQEFEGTITGLIGGKPSKGDFKEEPEGKKG